MGEFIKMIVDSTASKGIMLSLMVTIGGFGLKQAAHQEDVDHTLAWHSKVIMQIQGTQVETAKGLQEHTVTLSRIDGKLDVINQKIDDDRNYAQRHQTVNTR
jgi:hypothetical protein